MKTITEFTGTLIQTSQTKLAELKATEKTPEEVSAAMTEATKCEGDKLKHLMAAIESVGGKVSRLKRVIVLSLAENEKPPAVGLVKEGFCYQAEYFPVPLNEQKKARPEGGRGRDRDGRKGKGGRGKGGKGGRGDGRRPGGRPEGRGPGVSSDGAPLVASGDPAQGRKPRRDGGRPARPERPAPVPVPPEKRGKIIPRAQVAASAPVVADPTQVGGSVAESTHDSSSPTTV